MRSSAVVAAPSRKSAAQDEDKTNGDAGRPASPVRPPSPSTSSSGSPAATAADTGGTRRWPGRAVLVGQVVLERLDPIADCTKRTLTPRYEDYPLLKLKALGTRRQFGR